MDDSRKKCWLATRSILVALIGVTGLIMFIAGMVEVAHGKTDSIAHMREYMDSALFSMAGAFIMVISCLLPYCCVTECGDSVQKKLGIRPDYMQF